MRKSKKKEKALFTIIMKIFILVIGRITNSMVKVYIYLKIMKNIKENYKIIKKMDKESIYI